MDNWEAETLNISGIVDDSIVDGPGLRYTILPYIIKQEKQDTMLVQILIMLDNL